MDPQEGGEDVLDKDWEQEQRREIADLNRSFSKASSGCLVFCARPPMRDQMPQISLTSISQPVCNVDFVRPGKGGGVEGLWGVSFVWPGGGGGGGGGTLQCVLVC